MEKKIMLLSFVLLYGTTTFSQPAAEVVGKSPWGPHDEIGTLNMMTEASRLAVLSSIGSGQVYDLSMDYFVGMPSFHTLGPSLSVLADPYPARYGGRQPKRFREGNEPKGELHGRRHLHVYTHGHTH